MTNAQLQDMYDDVYAYTEILNDDALEILDEVVTELGVESIYDDWLDDEDLPEEDAARLAEAFLKAAARCEGRC